MSSEQRREIDAGETPGFSRLKLALGQTPIII